LTETSSIHIERAVLIGISTKTQNEEQTREYLDELEFLALTSGAETVKTVFGKTCHTPITKPI
jgi:GTP-binding protein HflX